MIKFGAFLLFGVLMTGCGAASEPVRSNDAAANTTRGQRSQSTIGHSAETSQPADSATNGARRKWTQSGDPIDTSTFDAAIKAAEMAIKIRPDDATAKAALAEAYFTRGEALTRARQYASALGDYRRAMKYEPNHAGSLQWEKQILGIYEGMNMEAPKPGEEPPPLPFRKS